MSSQKEGGGLYPEGVRWTGVADILFMNFTKASIGETLSKQFKHVFCHGERL